MCGPDPQPVLAQSAAPVSDHLVLLVSLCFLLLALANLPWYLVTTPPWYLAQVPNRSNRLMTMQTSTASRASRSPYTPRLKRNYVLTLQPMADAWLPPALSLPSSA